MYIYDTQRPGMLPHRPGGGGGSDFFCAARFL